MKKILIIINVHNGLIYIRNAIESVINQKYPVNLLIIDNASSDGTDLIAKSYVGSCVEYIRINNKITLGAARNYALNYIVDYDYFGFLDVDDVIIDDSYIKSIIEILSFNDVSFIYSNASIYKDGIHIGNFSKSNDKLITKKDILKRYDICFSSVIFVSKIFNNNKIRFKENLSICEDTDIILTILKFGKGYYINKKYIIFNISESSTLLNNIKKFSEELSFISKIYKLCFSERYYLNLVLFKTVISNFFKIGLYDSLIVLIMGVKNLMHE